MKHEDITRLVVLANDKKHEEYINARACCYVDGAEARLKEMR